MRMNHDLEFHNISFGSFCCTLESENTVIYMASTPTSKGNTNKLVYMDKMALSPYLKIG